MKKVIFTLSLVLATFVISVAQPAPVTFSTPKPKYGCPNTTHDVIMGVNNSYPIGVPANSYSVTVKIYTDLGAEFYNQTLSTTPAIPASGHVDITVEDIIFQGAMTCSLSIKIDYTNPLTSAPGTYTHSDDYTVQLPPTLTITENPTGTLNVTNTLEGVDSVRYYLDGNYTSHVNENTSGTFTPAVDGSYTAMAYEPRTGCISAAASNAEVITVSTTDVKNAQNVNVSVYPNPMASSVTITTKLSNKLTYEISDLNGAVVRAAEFSATTNVSVETLKAGSYILTVKDNNQTVASYKLVK